MIRHLMYTAAAAGILATSSMAFGAGTSIDRGFQFAAKADEGHGPEEQTKARSHPFPDCPGLAGAARDKCMKETHERGTGHRTEGSPVNQQARPLHARPDCPGMSGDAIDKCMTETHQIGTGHRTEGMPRAN